MIRDLVECSIRLVREEKMREVSEKARGVAENKIVAVLSDMKKSERGELAKEVFDARLLEDLRAGKFDALQIEIRGRRGAQTHGARSRRRGDQHRQHLRRHAPQEEKAPQDEREKRDAVYHRRGERKAHRQRRADERGARARGRAGHHLHRRDRQDRGQENRGGADVSREGVQRDILPIVEGCTVYDQVRRGQDGLSSCSSRQAPSISPKWRISSPNCRGGSPSTWS